MSCSVASLPACQRDKGGKGVAVLSWTWACEASVRKLGGDLSYTRDLWFLDRWK